MKIETKLNVGDKVWYISVRDGCGRQSKVTTITIQANHTGHEVTYTLEDWGLNSPVTVRECEENKAWWKDRASLVHYLLTSLKPVGNGKKSLPVGKSDISREFEKFFSDVDEPCEDQSKPPPPPVKKKPYMFVGDEPSGFPPSQVASELLSRMKKLPGIRPYRKQESEMVKDARRSELNRLVDEILDAEE